MRKRQPIDTGSSGSSLYDPDLLARYVEVLRLREMLAKAEKKQVTKRSMTKQPAKRSPRVK